jgi:hypothetical protein
VGITSDQTNDFLAMRTKDRYSCSVALHSLPQSERGRCLLSDLRLGKASGFMEKDFLSVKFFDVRVKLVPLLFKRPSSPAFCCGGAESGSGKE